MKRLVLAFLLIDFALLTGYALFVTGLPGVLDMFTEGNLWTYQLTADFLIALGISVAWMIGHARQRGTSWTPYLIATLLLGSIGPLLYVVVHATRSTSPAAPRTARAPKPSHAIA